jgi:zinc transporter 9
LYCLFIFSDAGFTSDIVWFTAFVAITGVAVLLEDSAAIIGLVIATACTGLSYVTGNVIYDGVGSILIGGLLGATAVFLIRKNTMYGPPPLIPFPPDAIITNFRLTY